MEMINYENSALSLDSMYHVLGWYDRVSIHRHLQEKNGLTVKAEKLLNFVQEYQWHPPRMKYSQNSTLEYYDPKTGYWLPAAEYSKNHPQFTAAVYDCLNIPNQ